jgi:ABC-type multidrug transport system fused ATPase/permease subunit
MYEATGALDPSTEASVLGGYDRLRRQRRTVVITHRLALARRCDRVVLVDGGRVKEDGSPERLESADGSFRALFVDLKG